MFPSAAAAGVGLNSRNSEILLNLTSGLSVTAGSQERMLNNDLKMWDKTANSTAKITSINTINFENQMTSILPKTKLSLKSKASKKVLTKLLKMFSTPS
jgi:hypothetical protein